MTNKRVLIVDDESVILQLYQLQLSDEYDIEVAESGEIGLEMIASNDPYAVVVSDMDMPGGMNGAQFLNEVRQRSAGSVRLMLTGVDRKEVAEDAVNEGQVFRFLHKPCPAEQLSKAICEALEQFRLQQAEKELLDKTLSGSVSLLVDLLSISSPLAFGRATRVKKIVENLCELTGVGSSWEITLAAMLCEVGCISLPQEMLEKMHVGEPLTAQEQRQFAEHPETGSKLVSKIPRLEKIGRLIASQLRPFSDAEGNPEDAELIWRAAYLHIALEYDQLIQAGHSPRRAALTIEGSPRDFSPTLARVLVNWVESQETQPVQEVFPSQLRPGMVLEADIVDQAGEVLLTRGNQLTELQVEQMQLRGSYIKMPIIVRGDSNAHAEATDEYDHLDTLEV